MKKLNGQLKHYPEQYRLSSEEKHQMRLAIEEHVRTHPLGATVSPWQRWMFAHKVALPTLAVLLLCTSTAYAAQGALPGDLLYPVKIHVNEQVEVAIATTPAAKSHVEAGLATRRVEEAQTLALRGTLSATTTRELQDSFNEHASEALALASEGEDHTEDKTGGKTDDKPVPTMAVRATLSAPMATTAATTSTSTIRAAAKRVRTLQDDERNQSSRLKASLDIQASILDTLQVQVKERDTKHEEKSARDEHKDSDSQ